MNTSKAIYLFFHLFWIGYCIHTFIRISKGLAHVLENPEALAAEWQLGYAVLFTVALGLLLLLAMLSLFLILKKILWGWRIALVAQFASLFAAGISTAIRYEDYKTLITMIFPFDPVKLSLMGTLIEMVLAPFFIPAILLGLILLGLIFSLRKRGILRENGVL